jgi:hypothetical protein
MKRCRIVLIPLLLLVAACGDAGRQGPSIHDTKYREAESGACVEDTVTGLIWEAKADAAGLHDWRNTYTHLGICPRRECGRPLWLF